MPSIPPIFSAPKRPVAKNLGRARLPTPELRLRLSPSTANTNKPRAPGQLATDRQKVWSVLPQHSKYKKYMKYDFRITGEKSGGTNLGFKVEAWQNADVDGTGKPIGPGMTGQARALAAMRHNLLIDQPTLMILPDKKMYVGGRKGYVGYIKVKVKNDPLSHDPRTWSQGQIDTVLTNAVLAELRGNYDQKTDQYVVPTNKKSKELPEPVVLNGDEDMIFDDYGKANPLNRFKRQNPGSRFGTPSAQSLLFHRYVHGEMDLDFSPIFDVIRRIEKVAATGEDLKVYQPAFEAVAAENRAKGKPMQTADALRAEYIRRRDGLRTQFEQLIAELKAERAHHASFRGHLPTPRNLRTWWKDQQLLVIGRMVDSPLVDHYSRQGRNNRAPIPMHDMTTQMPVSG